MKASLTLIFFFSAFSFSTAQNKNVGINNANPQAMLDIISLGEVGDAKALSVVNSSTTELFSLSKSGNVGVKTTDANAQLEITSPNKTVSTLRLQNLSISSGKTSADINYNNLNYLAIDENGNVLARNDVRMLNSNAITFDGSYNPSGSINRVLCSVNRGSIIKFIVHTGFAHGASGVGVVKYADVTWSAGAGFQVPIAGHDFANNNPNAFAVYGIGTNTLSLSVINGDNLIFQVVGNQLVYRVADNVTGVSTRTDGFTISSSFRSR